MRRLAARLRTEGSEVRLQLTNERTLSRQEPPRAMREWNGRNVKATDWTTERKGICNSPKLPLQPFAIHVRSFAADIRFEGPLEHCRPVQVSLVVLDFVLGKFIRGVQCSILPKPCESFAFDEARAEIWPVTRGVEWLPPVYRLRNMP